MEYHIPDDLVRGEEIKTLNNTLPPLWPHMAFLISELHKGDPSKNRPPITGKGIKIAINDTGYSKHIYLPEPIAARSFVGGQVTDVNGHGNHCAGISLGRTDSNGVALGIAPGADLIISKVLRDDGGGPTTAIANGREWAAKQKADIISESLGDNGGPPIREELASYDRCYADGVSICVAAMGNSGFNGDGRPGSYDRTISVGSLDRQMRRSGFSSVSNNLDIMFPGQDIVSCGTRGSNLVTMSGTSMATPGIAGCFALIMEYMQLVGIPRPMGWKAWREWLSQPMFTKDIGAPGKDRETGFGYPQMINIFEWMINPKGV